MNFKAKQLMMEGMAWIVFMLSQCLYSVKSTERLSSESVVRCTCASSQVRKVTVASFNSEGSKWNIVEVVRVVGVVDLPDAN